MSERYRPTKRRKVLPCDVAVLHTRRVDDLSPITGELQLQVIAALWRLEEATVEQVRHALPPRYRSAYTTVQTVLNRLVERGLLSRHKVGNAFVYRARLSEADYLSRSISQTLAGASTQARRAALARLVGELGEDEVTALRQLAREMTKRDANP
jgi:predicted transcriptional regulator